METDDLVVSGGAKVLRSAQALALLFGALVGAAVLMEVGISALSGLGLPDDGTLFELTRTVLQFTAFGIVVALFVAGANDWGLLDVSMPEPRELALAGGSVLVLLVLQYSLLVGLSTFGVLPVENRAIDADAHAPAYFLAMVAVSILVVGPAEELLFRGAIQGLLKRAWGMWPALVAASLVFGLIHYNVGAGSVSARLAYVGIATLLGLLLGYLYEYSENLVVPALAHGGYNAVAFGFQYLESIGAL